MRDMEIHMHEFIQIGDVTEATPKVNISLSYQIDGCISGLRGMAVLFSVGMGFQRA